MSVKGKPLLTHEMGSLAKPEWRVKAVSGKPSSEKDLEAARAWGERLGIDYQPLVELLRKTTLTDDNKEEVKRWASRYAIKLQEQAGLDIVFDGEQMRSEMYHYAVSNSEGFAFRGLVRSFDNKYYQKAACVAQPKLKKPYHLEEFQFLKATAARPTKVPITGAYTLADWSFDEHYAQGVFHVGSAQGRTQRRDARRNLVREIARNLVRPNIQALVDEGARWLQIDEPAVTTRPDEVPLFVEGFNESIQGIPNCRFSVHICFSDYRLLFPHIEGLENCWGFSVGFANCDTRELGVRRQVRPGYEILHQFKTLKQFNLGVGVLDIHTDYIESPELVRDRILYATEVLGDPARVHPCTDCGLRTRTWEVSYQKMRNLVEGTQLARGVLRV